MKDKFLRFTSGSWKFLIALFWAFIFVLIIRATIFKAYKIPTESMLNTLQVGDHMIVSRLSYGLKIPLAPMTFFASSPERNEIIVYKDPDSQGEDPWNQRDLVKRIVAIPGDTLEIIDKQLYINGEIAQHQEAIFLDDEILPREKSPRDNFGPITIPGGNYFLMGDNRDFSFDSRFTGFVREKLIVGKPIFLYWSWNSGEGNKLAQIHRIGTLIK